MSFSGATLTHCKLCSRELASSALACSLCHTLVHAEELQRLSAEAQGHEELNDMAAANACWSKALALLPPDSTQAEWIRKHLTILVSTPAESAAVEKRKRWISKLGPLAPIA